MRTETICHEVGEMSAQDVAEVAVAAIRRMGELGREAGEAFKDKAQALAAEPEFEEGMAQLQD